jgi:hypothetical protein
MEQEELRFTINAVPLLLCVLPLKPLSPMSQLLDIGRKTESKEQVVYPTNIMKCEIN